VEPALAESAPALVPVIPAPLAHDSGVADPVATAPEIEGADTAIDARSLVQQRAKRLESKYSAPDEIPSLPAETTFVAGYVWSEDRAAALGELITSGLKILPAPRSAAVSEAHELRPGVKLPVGAAPVPSSPGLGELEAAGVSSAPLHARELPAGGEVSFWFNVNAVLVVYGATEPGATVAIGGRKIRLRPDGTFSYRFALPDGAYDLDIAATAKHGDKRRVRLKFSRGSSYSGEVGHHPQDQTLKTPAAENVE
jgi:hypothetical protein